MPEPDHRRRRVVIVGGGIAGLSLSCALEQEAQDGAPIESLVLEASSRLGGLIRTERVSGYLCEWGPNGVLDNAPATMALIDRLGLEERVLPSDDAARRRFIFRGGSLREVPDGVWSFLRTNLLSWPGKLRVFAEPLARGRVEEDESIHDFARRRIGAEAAEILIGSMVSGIFAGDAHRLSLPACFPRMREMEDGYGSLVRAMLALRRAKRRGEGLETLRPVPGPGETAGPRASSATSGSAARDEPARSRASDPSGRANRVSVGMPGGRLTSFTGGMQDLIDALAASSSDRIRTETKVTALEKLSPRPMAPGAGDPHSFAALTSLSSLEVAPTKDSPSTRWRIGLSRGDAVEADTIVLALPARASAPLVRSFDHGLSDSLLEIETAPLVVTCLGYGKSRLPRSLDGFGFLVAPDQGPRILGALWDSSIYPNRAPEGRALIRVMVGGARDPGAIDLSDDAILDVVRRDLESTMSLRADPELVHIVRQAGGIPQYTLGHLPRVRAIESRLAHHPGLYLAGNSFHGVSINACVAEAAPLARRIIDELRRES